MDLRTKLENLTTSVLQEFGQVLSLEHLENLRIEYLGRKGIITDLMSRLQELPKEERPSFGQQTNALKQKITALLDEKKADLEKAREAAFLANFDPTLQSRQPWEGSIHPINLVMEDICNILQSIGFDVVVGPEVETDYYNFQTLNFPDDHPARDMQDTLFVADKILLRTHTSPMQVRSMLERKPPLAIIAPGKVYRRDSDITHTPMFHQVEGLLVGYDISMAHLRGILSSLCKSLFGDQTQVRFRPSFFPFTEPSLEVDISCFQCGGSGHIGNDPCRICKTTGWLEILGSGMVDPAVFEAVGYDSTKVSGFAFGMGVERVAMLKYGITDLRINFENDVRFLSQFAQGDAWKRS